MISKFSLITLFAAMLFTTLCSAQSSSGTEIFPDSTWYKYTSPEQAGWSSKKIANIHAFADSVGSDAVMLIYDGAVVAAWGYYAEIEYIASINKTLISALYGIAVDNGTFDTSATLAALEITGKPPLTETEKHASVVDLLSMGPGLTKIRKTGMIQVQSPARNGFITAGILPYLVPYTGKKQV